jgi:hypothetical protein
VSPSTIIVQCNSCKSKFRSDDFRDSPGYLSYLSLFSPPTELVERTVVTALDSLKQLEIPFWRGFRLDPTWILKHSVTTGTKWKADYLGGHPGLSPKSNVMIEFGDTALKVAELGLVLPYRNIMNIETVTSENQSLNTGSKSS